MAIQTPKQQQKGQIKGVEKTRIVNSLSSQITSLEAVEKEKLQSISILTVDVDKLLGEQKRLKEETVSGSKELEDKILEDAKVYFNRGEVLSKELKVVKKTLKKARTTLQEAEAELANKTVELQELGKATTQAKISDKVLTDSIAQHEAELEELTKNAGAKNELIRKLSDDIAVLEAKRKELSSVTDGLLKQQELAKGLSSEIILLDKDKKVREKEVIGLNDSIGILKSEEETLRTKHEDKLAEITKREGDLSLRESWLLDKEETLKGTKEELEKFYNRKINSVII